MEFNKCAAESIRDQIFKMILEKGLVKDGVTMETLLSHLPWSEEIKDVKKEKDKKDKKEKKVVPIVEANVAICITAGEQSENHAGMQINGDGLAACGFSVEELVEFCTILKEKGIDSEYIRLDDYLEDKDGVEPASLLIIRNGVEKLAGVLSKDMLSEQLSFEWDKKYWDTRRSKVLNKLARYNVCYGQEKQEPDYENKKGTIISYEKAGLIDKWRKSLEIFGEKATNLEVEGNLYYDIKKCGIGFHGDSERKKVIACSLGGSRPIHWQWYYKSQTIGERIKFVLNSGDMYIMSEKTSGYDWKKRNTKTLRHAAGEKYTK